jgi:hypothetical protein
MRLGMRALVNRSAACASMCLGIAAAFVIPAAVSATCNYNTCSVPPGYCQNGVCSSYNERQSVYYDYDCNQGSIYCQWDICFFYEYFGGGGCGAQCYSGDRFFCNGNPNCEAICGDDQECACGCHGGFWSCEGSVCGCTYSPLLINLSSNTANDRLTSPASGVPFDLNADGVPERVAWTSLDSAVAFLTLDRNGNGAVDDGTELFGTATRKQDGTLAKNGFDPLAEYDLNGDGKIDERDGVYSQLRLWIDTNHNGYSEPGELTRLEEGHVGAVFLEYKESRRQDQFGNRYRFEGRATIVQDHAIKTRRVFDVYLMKE